MRTIRPAAHDISFTVELLNVSYQGHVIFSGHNQENHSLHVFTLNGRHLASVNLSHRVTGQTLARGSYNSYKIMNLHNILNDVLSRTF